MPGDRENVVKLNADHSKVCKFGSGDDDQDNFKLVRANIRDLYQKALTCSELNSISSLVGEDVNSSDALLARFVRLKQASTGP